jgi:hypothetical protein
MTHPNDDSVRAFLRRRGAAPHVVAGGSENLVAGWRHFVSQVEAGYPLGLDDYRNDLDIRSLIELAGLAAQVEDEDHRFRALLTRTDLAVWSSDTPDAWWVRGYPTNASGELLVDLKARAGI